MEMRRAAPRDGVSPAVMSVVTWGLLAAFVVHDVEELLTMPRFNADLVRRAAERFPDVPDQVWDRLRIDGPQATVAIGLMGVLVGGAAARGASTGGRSPAFQAVLAGFGLHGVTHLAQSALLRRYTPGVVTAPGVVAYSWWAWRRLRAAGLVTDVETRRAASSFALFPLVLGGVHATAYVLRRVAESTPCRISPSPHPVGCRQAPGSAVSHWPDLLRLLSDSCVRNSCTLRGPGIGPSL